MQLALIGWLNAELQSAYKSLGKRLDVWQLHSPLAGRDNEFSVFGTLSKYINSENANINWLTSLAPDLSRKFANQSPSPKAKAITRVSFSFNSKL